MADEHRAEKKKKKKSYKQGVEEDFPPLHQTENLDLPDANKSLLEKIKFTDSKILNSLIKVGRTTNDEQVVDELAKEFQVVRGLILDLSSRVGTLEGEQSALREPHSRTFAETTRAMSSREPQEPRAPTPGKKQEALPVMATLCKPHEAAKVAEETLKNFDPAQLGSTMSLFEKRVKE